MRSSCCVSFILMSLSCLLPACGAPPDASASGDPGVDVEFDRVDNAATASSPAYVDVEQTFTDDRDFDQWFALERRLRQAFDDVCGDTFCEGDYANLTALGFRCSASARTGRLKSCLWLFAGSSESITPSTGFVRPGGKLFACRFAPAGSARDLMNALADGEGWDLLHKPLPGGAPPLYDVIGDCL